MTQAEYVSRLPFAVMAKPVGSFCNLRCCYCYYLKADEQHPIGREYLMSDEILEKFIREYIQNNPAETIPFTWHGGEPALAGLAFFKRAVELQRKYLPAGKTVWNNLQTNGTLLNDEWCAFLAENHWDVGLSIDGSAAVHDKYRRDAGGAGTFERVREACLRLKRHGVLPDLLCTVTADSAADPLAVYRGLRELDTGWIQFIPIVRWIKADGSIRDTAEDAGLASDRAELAGLRPTVSSQASHSSPVTPESVTGRMFGEFLNTIFDEWVAQDIGRIDVQLFAETCEMIAGGTPRLCTLGETCGRVLVLESDGSVYACDHFVQPEYKLGNILDRNLAELADLPEQLAFGRAKRDVLPVKCRQCPRLRLCHGGCLKDRYLPVSSSAPIHWLCEGYEMFYAHAVPDLRALAGFLRQGMRPAEAAAAMRSRKASLWKGIGRNDPCPCGSGKKFKNCHGRNL